MNLPQGIKPKYGVFTTDREFAEYMFGVYIQNNPKSKVIKRIRSINESYVAMEDGTVYKWIRPSENARGYKLSAATIDLATCDLKYIQEWIPYICLFAEKQDYIFADSTKIIESHPYDLHTLIDRLQKIEAILGNTTNITVEDSSLGSLKIENIDVFGGEINVELLR